VDWELQDLREQLEQLEQLAQDRLEPLGHKGPLEQFQINQVC
jgi:hypothetical protein